MISAIILTHNSQSTITRLVNKLSFCGQIIVVDDFSTDTTYNLLKKLSVETYQRHLNHNFASQRNFALSKAVYQWVLFIDSDETVSPQLKKSIIQATNSISNIQGYYIKRRDIFLGSVLKHGEAGSTRILRLARKKSGYWVRCVHEAWDINGQTATLNGFIYHKSHPNISSFIDKINFYTNIEAQSRNFSLFQFLLFPPVKFVHNYLFRFGFLDGYPGLIYAYIMSFHSLLVRLKTYHETS